MVLHDETSGVDALSDDQAGAAPMAFTDLGAVLGWAMSDAAVVSGTSTVGNEGAAVSDSEVFSLDVSAAGVDSGLEVLSGAGISLYMLGDLVVGRVNDISGGVPGVADPAGDIAFAISIDQAGKLSTAQYVPLMHVAGDPDDVVSITDGALLAVVTATDGDGDTDTDPIGIGAQVKFRDDGPTADIALTGETVVHDESAGSRPAT